MADPLTLDVVIPSVKSTRSLERTVRSFGRDHAASLHIHVVDDRPPRVEVEELCRHWGARYHRTGGRRGPGAARNLGAFRGRAAWLLFVDDDVEIEPPGHERIRQAFVTTRDAGAVAAMGMLRPPVGAPRWLLHAYGEGVLTSAGSTPTRPQSVPPVRLASALLLVRRDVFESIGGFPEIPGWGWEDAVLGLRLGEQGPALHVPVLSGVHHDDPSWTGWLERQFQAGRSLAQLVPTLTEEQRETLLRAVVLEHRPRAYAKRIAGYVPAPVLRHLRVGGGARLAASAAFARGYRHGQRERTKAT